MSEFQPKPKRKRGSRNPYLFLGAGIVIGVLIAALLGAAFLFVGVSSTETTQSGVSVVAEQAVVSPFPTATVILTAAPFSAQQVQPTVVANRIQAAAISDDGEHLAVVSVENGISHIYLTELRVEANLSGTTYDLYQAHGYFSDVVFSPDGSKLIATIDSGFTVLLDVRERRIIEEFPNIGGAAFTTDSERLVLVGRNNGIRVLSLQTDTIELVDQLVRTDGFFTVGAVAVSADGKIAVGLDDNVEIYEIGNLDEAPLSLNLNMGFVHDLTFTDDGENLAIAVDGNGASTGNVIIYNIEENSRSFYDFGTRVFAIAFSPDGEWLAAAGGESGYGESRLIAYRWDTNSNPIPPNPAYYQPIEFTGHEHTIYDVGFTPEGYLLSAGWDGSVRLWDIFSPNNALSIYYP